VKFSQTAQIPVAREPLWNFLMDVPRVAKSLPGVESVSKIDDTTYEGALTVRVGPIKLNLQGKIILEEQNKDAWRAALRAEAKDRMAAGAVNGWFIAFLGLSPFVVTLGMLSIARSLAIVLSQNKMIYDFGPDADIVFAIGGGETFGIANPVWLLLALIQIWGIPPISALRSITVIHTS